MQGLRDQFLAGARFAIDEYGGVGLRETADGAKHFLHSGCVAEDVRCIGQFLATRGFALALRQRTAYQLDRMIHIERFGQVLEGAALKRGHRTFQIGVRGHDDDRQGGMLLAQGLQQVQTGTARHADVADDHLGRVVRKFGHRFVGGSKTLVLDLLACQGFFQHPADRAVVVDDPDRFAHINFP